MRSILGLIDQVTERVVGRVDAGACVVEHLCCCKTGHPHYGISCYGNCQYFGTGFRCLTGPKCSFT
jgi:hypothetical protein